ncbi:MAG: hypothetical protein QXK37_04470 [Candidatus Woesearchaeota archaeon]
MHSRDHFIIALLTVAVISKISTTFFSASGVLIMLAVTVAIDLDHIITFLLTHKGKKTWSAFVNDMNYHFSNKKQRFYLFHKIEFVVVLFFLSSMDAFFSYAFIGVALHLCADIFVYCRYHKSFQKIKYFLYFWDIRCVIKKVPAYH